MKKLMVLLVFAVLISGTAMADGVSAPDVSKNAASVQKERDGRTEEKPFAAEEAPFTTEELPFKSVLDKVSHETSAASCCEWEVMNDFCNDVCGPGGWSSNTGTCHQGHCQITCNCTGGPGVE